MTAFNLLQNAILSAALVLAALLDRRHGRVPNTLTFPILAASVLVLMVRAVRGELDRDALTMVMAAWGIGLTLWWLRVFGGGDVKLALGLVTLFPESRLVGLLLACLLVGLFATLVSQEGRRGLQRLRWLALSAIQGSVPTREEIAAAYKSRGRRVTWLISLAGLLYLWLPALSGF